MLPSGVPRLLDVKSPYHSLTSQQANGKTQLQNHLVKTLLVQSRRGALCTIFAPSVLAISARNELSASDFFFKIASRTSTAARYACWLPTKPVSRVRPSLFGGRGTD